MMKRGWMALVATAVLLAGCATLTHGPWKVERVVLPDKEYASKVTFQAGGEPLVVREQSPYLYYRSVARKQYGSYHIPPKAKFALIATQDLNNDVLYVMKAPGKWEVYTFSFGKFDIDWPPKKLGEVPQ